MSSRNNQWLENFLPIKAPRETSIGGSNPRVQNRSESVDGSLLSRINGSPAVAGFLPERDPRYEEKDTMVENVYQPPHELTQRPGLVQIWNWLTKGSLS